MKRRFLAALAVAGSIGLAGCASSTGGKNSEREASYSQYLNSTPSFEVQSVGDDSVGLLLSSIAGYARNQHEKLLAVRDAVEGNPDGYKVQVNLDERRGDSEATAEYVSSLDAEAKLAHQNYAEQMDKLTAVKENEREEILKATVAITKIDEASLTSDMNMLQKANAVKSLANAVKQANYAKQSMEWLGDYNAVLKNVVSETGI